MIKREIDEAAPMAVLCAEARAKMDSARCFNPQCGRCWPVVGPVVSDQAHDPDCECPEHIGPGPEDEQGPRR